MTKIIKIVKPTLSDIFLIHKNMCFARVWLSILPPSPLIQLYMWRQTIQAFWLYFIWVVLTKNLLENLHHFITLKYCMFRISKLRLQRKKISLFLRIWDYHTVKLRFIDQKLNCWSLLFKLPVKLKGLNFLRSYTVKNATAFETYSQKRAYAEGSLRN